MAEPKTTPTDVAVSDHLASIQDDVRRADCEALIEMMARVTGHAPVMWGPSIVGFDRYHYRYPSGHEGDAAVVGFASGKRHITLYLAPGFEGAETRELLGRLGRHKTGKGCLYVTRLEHVDRAVLEALVTHSVAAIRSRYPDARA